MATKKVLPVCFLLMWLLAMAFVWWMELNPGRWKTETITFSHFDQVEVSTGRYGGKTIYHVIVDAEGRCFGLSDSVAAEVQGKLSYGEECTVLYEPAVNGSFPHWIEGLSTTQAGEVVSPEAALAAIRQDRRSMWWIVGIPVVVCLLAEVLIEWFGCRKEQARIAQLKAQQAKFIAREARQNAYKKSKRAGE